MAVYQEAPAITAGAYSANDIIGGDMTLSGAGVNTNFLAHIMIYDDAGQKARIDFFIFDAPLTGTYTDNAAFSIATADKPNLRGFASVVASDYIDAGSDAVGQTSSSPNIPINRAPGENNLYIVAVVRGTPTYAAVTDLRFEFGFI